MGTMSKRLAVALALVLLLPAAALGQGGTVRIAGQDIAYTLEDSTDRISPTREEFAAMVCRALSYRAPSGDDFPDHADISDWALDAVYTLKTMGVLQGDGSGRVNPKAEISREEMFTMIHRAMEYMNMYGEPPESNVPVFADYDSISTYAGEAVDKLLRYNLIKGDGEYLNPRDATTRAESTQILYNLLKYDQTVLP